MKKLTTLLLAAGMVFAASAPASAVDVKVDGVYDFSFVTQSTGFEGQNVQHAAQRLRLGLSFIQSENLSGYFQAQVGVDEWGVHSNIDGNSEKHGNGISARQAYIDWIIPQTVVKVRMGRSLFGLPADAISGHNAIFDNWSPTDGIVVNAPVTDWLTLNAFWGRVDVPAEDVDGKPDSVDVVQGQRNDAFGLAANMKFDGVSVSPYVMYAALDKDATHKHETYTDKGDYGMGLADANAYWFGVTSTFTLFDPFTFKLSGAYGEKSYEGNVAGLNITDRKGWYVQGLASYATSYGTPFLAAWYATGDDADDQYRHGWIPTMGGRFTPTMVLTDGGTGLYNGVCNYNIGGTWGVQVGWSDISFVQDLTHEFKVAMFQGTNNSANPYATSGADGSAPQYYMTTGDRVFEFDFTSSYKIYKNLTATLELAYLINDFDNGLKNREDYDEDDWNASLHFAYKF